MSIVALEIFFVVLLVLAGVAMAGFAGLVVYGLFKGQK
ncbi:putative membrane protein YGL010W [Arthrobacter roseus]|nr:putative membrane protein YGL010W [Arthrobacter roseus]